MDRVPMAASSDSQTSTVRPSVGGHGFTACGKTPECLRHRGRAGLQARISVLEPVGLQPLKTIFPSPHAFFRSLFSHAVRTCQVPWALAPAGHVLIITVLLLTLGSSALLAQTTHQTIRHHNIAEADPNFPPELIQAEAAIDKKDYATAEPLLNKIVATNPANHQAWFDLAFLYNALGQTDDSIAAYRAAVTAKQDIFESNLNLGLMLARENRPDAQQFLRAATN